MTKIEVHYVNGDGIVYYVDSNSAYGSTYTVDTNCIRFRSVASQTLDISRVLIPFNNVVSIKIWEESDDVDEQNKSRQS